MLLHALVPLLTLLHGPVHAGGNSFEELQNRWIQDGAELVKNQSRDDVEPCTELDLTQPGGALAAIPVRRQNYSVCYGYSATAMTDAYRHSLDCKGQPADSACWHQSSVLEAVATARRDRPGRELLSLLQTGEHFAGGEACSVVNSILENGSCDPSSTVEMEESVSKGTESLLEGMTQYFRTNRSASGGSADYRRDLAFTILNSLKKLNSSELFRILLDPAGNWEDQKGTFKGVSVPVPLGNLPSSLETQRLLQGTEGAFLAGAIHGKCKPTRISKRGLKCSYSVLLEPFSRTDAMRSRLDAVLREGQVPEISFCSEFLKESTYRGGGKNLWDTFTKSQCGAHSVVIGGRRWNQKKNRCEYLIHNSWGTSCGPYSREWECEKGRVWVDADALAWNVGMIGRIVPQ